MCTDNDVFIVDDEIPDRGGGHVEAQWQPVATVVERSVDSPFRAPEEETILSRILTDDIHGSIAGEAGDNLFPRFSRVACFVDMRVHVIEPYAVHGHVCLFCVEMTCLDA